MRMVIPQLLLDEGVDAAVAEELLEAVCRHPRHKQTLQAALSFCGQPMPYEELEDFVDGLCGGNGAVQEPCALIGVLLRHGGLTLQETYLFDGVPLTAEELETMPLEALAQAEHRRILSPTPEGICVAESLNPVCQIRTHLQAEGDRGEVFASLLSYCLEPRSLSDITTFIRELWEDARIAADGRPARLEASYFIDRLERVGALSWQANWVTTESGKQFLDSVHK